jgi:hypothetical protein
MGITTSCKPKTCVASSKAIDYGIMSLVTSHLQSVVRMKKTRASLTVLKIGIANITISLLDSATLLCLSFIKNLVIMSTLKMFGISYLVVI